MNIKKKFQTLLTTAFFVGVCTFAQAQLPPGPGDPGPDPGGTNAPIDGGLSLLIAAGVGYAAKRKYDKRKKENEPNIDQDSK